MKTLTVYSKPQCHLCELLLDELATLVDASIPVEIVNISEDPDLMRRFGLRIPILSCDGQEISGYPLDSDRVRAVLATQVN